MSKHAIDGHVVCAESAEEARAKLERALSDDPLEVVPPNQCCSCYDHDCHIMTGEQIRCCVTGDNGYEDIGPPDGYCPMLSNKN